MHFFRLGGRYQAAGACFRAPQEIFFKKETIFLIELLANLRKNRILEELQKRQLLEEKKTIY